MDRDPSPQALKIMRQAVHKIEIANGIAFGDNAWNTFKQATAEIEALAENAHDIDARNLRIYDRRLHQICQAILSVQPMFDRSIVELVRALHYISQVALGQEDSRIAEQGEYSDADQ